MNSIVSTLADQRHQLLRGTFAAIDTEYKINLGNDSKHYTLYGASIVDNNGKIKNRHIMDFQDHSQPEKELAKWFMKEILGYQTYVSVVQQGRENIEG